MKDLDGGNYLGVFIPGGHGVLNDIPFSEEVKKTLHWAHDNDRYVISLCHGPAGLLAAGIGERKDDFLYRGYEMCVFPDSLDTGANIDIGYIPGPMPRLVGERLRERASRSSMPTSPAKCIRSAPADRRQPAGLQ